MQTEPLTHGLVTWIQASGLAGTIPPARMEHHVLIGRFTAEMLAILGCDDLEIRTSVAVLEKMMFDHAIGVPKLVNLHQLICTPQAVYRSASRPHDSIVVITLEVLRGAPIMATVHLNKRQARGQASVHWVTSCYAKDNPAIIQRWETDGLTIWKP